MLIRNNKNFYGYLFIAPFLIIFIIFSAYPILNTFYLSFTDANFMNGFHGKFVGFKNYRQLLSTDVFFTSAKNTWFIWLGGFIPQMGFALLLSVMFTNQRLKLKGSGLAKAVFFLPNLLMSTAVAALFSVFLGMYGPVNKALVQLGLTDSAINFLTFPHYTQITVMFIQWWMWFGQTAIVLVAGMTAISPIFYEAAVIDGATQFQMFRKITLPLLKPIMLYTLIVSLVGGLQLFDIPYMITDGTGSPGGSVLTMNMLMNLKRSGNGALGSAASVSVLIFTMTLIVALFIFYLMRDKDAYLDKPLKKGRA